LGEGGDEARQSIRCEFSDGKIMRKECPRKKEKTAIPSRHHHARRRIRAVSITRFKTKEENITEKKIKPFISFLYVALHRGDDGKHDADDDQRSTYKGKDSASPYPVTWHISCG